LELPRLDTQALENSEVSGIHYQRGTLFGYEVWDRLDRYAPLGVGKGPARSSVPDPRPSGSQPALPPGGLLALILVAFHKVFP
jgi:hypothetical protein